MAEASAIKARLKTSKFTVLKHPKNAQKSLDPTSENPLVFAVENKIYKPLF